MTIASTLVTKDAVGDQYDIVADVNLGVYATNGVDFSVLAAQLGLGVGNILWIQMPLTATHYFVVDYANKKIKAYVASTNAEVANTTDISAQVSRALIRAI